MDVSNVEHLFENALAEYAYSSNSYDMYKKLKCDINCDDLSDEVIDAVYQCAIYVLNNLFMWDKDKFKRLWFDDEII